MVFYCSRISGSKNEGKATNTSAHRCTSYNLTSNAVRERAWQEFAEKRCCPQLLQRKCKSIASTWFAPNGLSVKLGRSLIEFKGGCHRGSRMCVKKACGALRSAKEMNRCPLRRRRTGRGERGMVLWIGQGTARRRCVFKCKKKYIQLLSTQVSGARSGSL